MSFDREPPDARGVRLSAVQLAVFAACVIHTRESFLPITPEIWWRAEPPFHGRRATFASHLRALLDAGILTRRADVRASYELTLRGEALARDLRL